MNERELRAEIERLNALILQLAERLFLCAEILARNAERKAK